MRQMDLSSTSLSKAALSKAALSKAAADAIGQADRYRRMATTILRAGIVPARLDHGVEMLPSLMRYGTTIAGLFAGAAAAVGDRPAIIDDHGMLTFAGLNDRAAALASALAEHHHLGSGDAIGLLAHNHAGFIETLLACGRLGADVILLNTGMSPAQAAVVAGQQDLRLIVADPDLVELMHQADEGIQRVICGDRLDDGGLVSTNELIGMSQTSAKPSRPSEPGRTVVMTSGTTGAPKGAKRPSKPGPEALAAILSRIPIRANGAVFIAPPLFHTWGLANLQMAGATRSTIVLRREFDPAEALAAVSAHGCSVLAVVPVMLQRILDLPSHERPMRDLTDLQIVASSGSAMPGKLATRWMEQFGPNLYNLYGSTEVSWATIATPEDLKSHPDTAGKAPLGTQIAIIGEDDTPLPTGETGSIYVGNALLFEGYSGDQPTKRMRQGMMATGDVGHLDSEGLLFVAGRDDDMIVSGGENVYPRRSRTC